MYKCKDATIRVKEFKAISLKGVFQASLSYNCDQTIISRYGKNVKWDFVSRKIYAQSQV